MSRTALAVVLVAASASSAFAGGFVGLGLGTGAASSGDVALNEDGRSGRLMLGYSWGLKVGRISVEGIGTMYDMVSPDAHEWSATTLGVAGRYNFPLSDNFEAIGRLGLQRTDVSNKEVDASSAGNGFLLGAGFEYQIPIKAASIAAFVDYTIVHSSLSSMTGATDIGLTSRIWTLGGEYSF